MHFPVSNRVLLQGIIASGLVLAGATACSRSDRTQTSSDKSAAVTQDTAMAAAGRGSGGTTTGMSTGADTTTPTGSTTARTPSNAPRAATAPPSADRQETAAAGYRAMERDTANLPESDSARVTQDTSSAEIAVAIDDTAARDLGVADTAAAGYFEMARDTNTPVDQIDTTGVAASADGAIQARVDTSHVDAEVTADADVSADSGIAAGAADTTGNAGRIHPPEDSTEILGVESERSRPPEDSTEILGSVNSSETADEEPINADDREISADDRETVATSESRTDDVGAAALGGTVTGAEAVALMTRQGVRCSIVDPESNEAVRWDMSSTPVTLNPCGLGSMVLSRVWTER